MRGALSVPAFRWLFTGQLVSALGDQLFPVAVAALVVERGGSASELGLVLAARFGALVLFALLGGVWADRLPRVGVLQAADALRLVAVAGLAVDAALSSGRPSVPLLAALVFVVGAGEAFFRPALGALLPSVLPAEVLGSGNALNNVTQHIALVAGPGLAGLALLVVGPAALFVVDAATFAVSLATLLRVTEPAREPAVRRRLLQEMGEGLTAVRQRPWIGAVLVMATLQLLFFVAPCNVLLPVVLHERGEPASAYGLVLALGATGGLVGALLAGRWQPAARGTVGLVLLVLCAAEPFALLVHAAVPLLVAAWFLSGIGVGPFLVWWETALQEDVPSSLVGRVVSLDWMCSLALLPAGLALTGPVTALVGRGPVLATGVVVVVVTSLLPLAVPGIRELRTPSDGRRTAEAQVRA